MTSDLLLAVHSAGRDRVRLWAGCISQDGAAPDEVRLRLQPSGHAVSLPAAGWRLVTAGGTLSPENRRVFVQAVDVDGLTPGTRYTLGTDLTEKRGARCRFSALPAELPGPADRPFNVLLGSCFSQPNDVAGTVGRALRQLPDTHQPDVKLLCGDQVYLDLPSGRGFPDDRQWLADHFLGTYVSTFFQRGGFADLLGVGACYFAADDHEYWNNFPNSFILADNTWSDDGRKRWRDIAFDLYRDFQCDDPRLAGRPRRFEVGPLSFLILDTRTFRGAGKGPLLLAEDRDAVVAWIKGLKGPGVLCVTQPLFEGRSGLFARSFMDRTLPDYDDYGALCAALAAAPHDVVLVSGDVHFGRVATCALGGGQKLVEVLSSPLSLCDARVGGKSRPAAARFPTDSDRGAPQRPTQTLYTTAEENFATLQFSQRGGRPELSVRYWFPRSAPLGSTRSQALPPIPLG